MYLMKCSWIVGPSLYELVEFGAGALCGAHVPMPLQNVGTAEFPIVHTTLDQLLNCIESGVIGHSAGEVANDADTYRYEILVCKCSDSC